jgi:hypothetical protein
MVSKREQDSEIEQQISAEDEARLNRELGLTESATAALVRPSQRQLSDADLRALVSFEEYLAEYADEVIKSEDFVGSGAERLVKDEWMAVLMNVPVAIIQFNFTDSAEFNSWFVHCEVITAKNHRYALTSGAKFGIRDQLYDLAVKEQRFNHVICENGLIDQPWSWTDPDSGKTRTIHVPTLPGTVAQKPVA